MTRNKKIIAITLIAIAILLISIWFFLDSHTKNSLYQASLCKLIYGKNICNFYAMMDTQNPSISDFDKMIGLCRDMNDVPKKDSCFEYIAQVFSRIDIEKAQQACDEIKEFREVHKKNDCYSKIITNNNPCTVCINGCDTCPEGCKECLIGIEKKLKDPNMKWYYNPELP